MLLELAAEALKVPQAQLVAKDGVIFDRQNKEQRRTYGQLAKGQKIERHLQGKPALKAGRQIIPWWASRWCGGMAGIRSPARPNTPATLREPGMLYAKVLRPPAHGAKLKSVDTAPAKAIAGVQVVQDGDLVAVLHELPDVAEAALEKIKAEFDVPEPTRGRQDHLRPPAQGRPPGQSGG